MSHCWLWRRWQVAMHGSVAKKKRRYSDIVLQLDHLGTLVTAAAALCIMGHRGLNYLQLPVYKGHS